MGKVLKILGALLALVLVVAGGFFMWAKSATAAKLDRSFEAHEVDFPVPFPLSGVEIAALRKERAAKAAAEAPAPEPEVEAAEAGAAEGEAAGGEDAEGEDAEGEAAEGEDAEGEDAESATAEEEADPLEGVDLGALALERALERGRHLVESRYACVECHGKDFSGGVMIDDPAIGRLLGPNLTGGNGSRVGSFAIKDWDRMVRHGIKPDGRPGAMPSEDYQRMSDQELSDIIAFIRSQPKVDNQVPPVELGPVGTILIATGELPLAADKVHDHQKDHPKHPPATAETTEFGQHVLGVCTGCHRETFEGGPVPGGPPDWAPARNLTPHAEGLAGWTFENFVTALREGTRPDGTKLKLPMSLMMPYAQKMTETELKAMWAHLQSVPPLPTGK